MAEETVVIVARMKAKEGMEETMAAELSTLVKGSQAETGCINYSLHQEPGTPTNFLIYEQWASKDALGAHAQSPHFKAFGAKGKELMAEPPDITFWKAL
ncbi:MAG: antibiotic biosynthesis monooxygenase [Deltaproteobacteria bacterium]|nr:antibiotic biosynthesis monooxygenase [Deltaproteobacteria bacterium]